MAIYRCEVKSHSRRAGKNRVSAVAAIAYRTGARLLDNKGQEHNYTKRHGVEHSQIITPANAPDWAQNRQALWAAADRAEKRADAKFGREFIVALPHELSAAARTELAIDFTRLLVKRFGFVADVAVHKPETGNNHHAHIFCSTRTLTAEGFGEKTRELDDKRRSSKLVNQIRADWEELANAALAKAGLDVRIDRRSHAELGDGLLPQASLTRYDAELERQGTPTINGDYNRRVVKRNAKMQLEREAQEAIKNAIAAQEAQAEVVRQAETAKRAKIDDLTQKQAGFDDAYVDSWERLVAKQDELKRAEDKINVDEANERAGRSSNPYTRYYGTERAELKAKYEPLLDAARADVHKAATAWRQSRAELEELGHSFEPPPKPSLWERLSGKKPTAQQREDNYAHALGRLEEFAPAVKRHELNEQRKQWQAEAEAEAKYKADAPQRAQQEAEAAKARELENMRIRAENVARRDDVPSADNKPRPRPDDDSPSPF